MRSLHVSRGEENAFILECQRVGLNELLEKFFSVIYSCRTRQDLHPRVLFFFYGGARRESHFCPGKRVSR